MSEQPRTVSIVLAADHVPGEALSLHALGSSVRELLQAFSTTERRCEVIVVVGDPAGDVASCAIANGARVVYDPFDDRSNALRTGAAASRGDDVVVVLDTLPPSPAKVLHSLEVIDGDGADLVVSARWLLYRRLPHPVFVTMARTTANLLELYATPAPFVATLLDRADEAALRVKALRVG